MQRTLKRLFLTIEISLILWFVLVGQTAPAKITNETPFWRGEVSMVWNYTRIRDVQLVEAARNLKVRRTA